MLPPLYKPIHEEDAWVQVELAWLPTTDDAAVGSFVAFMRDESRSRELPSPCRPKLGDFHL
jgi:hypothetical protein